MAWEDLDGLLMCFLLLFVLILLSIIGLLFNISSQTVKVMKAGKSILFYVLFIGIFALFVWLIIQQGKTLEQTRNSGNIRQEQQTDYSGGELSKSAEQQENNTGIGRFLREFAQSIRHPLSILLLQIMSIILFAGLFGIISRKIGQPTVIGEIIAGIVLGPSVLGAFLPEVSSFLFPASSLNNLSFLSQIGLILFMFIIGMELDIKILKNQAHEAVILSHASIIFPYFLGVAVAYFIYTEFAPPETSFLSFALFMGIAMSITAFPVLARILQEKGLTKTPLGILAITCAAADDITAWCILAAVIAIVKAGSIVSALFTIALALFYVVFMLKVAQPLLQRLGRRYITKEYLNRTIVAFVFITLLMSSFLTEVIGIHLLFGAFMAGVIMPQDTNFKRIFSEKIEDVSLVLLLPLFFVFTGLRTEIGLISNLYHWLICALIIFAAVLGKLGGSAIAARFAGQSWKNSLSIGILMNTRGLMELVALNIGYDLGVLSPEIFTMMVIMALVTTFMSGPLLELMNYIFKTRDIAEVPAKSSDVLISFGLPRTGHALLRLANLLLLQNESNSKITALHITPDPETRPDNADYYAAESFSSLEQLAKESNLHLHTKYMATGRVDKEIIKESRTGKYGLILLGGARSMFKERNTLGRKVRSILNETDNNVGVLFNSDLKDIHNVLLILNNPEDKFLLLYAVRIASGENISLTIFDNKRLLESVHEDYKELLTSIKDRLSITNNAVIDYIFLKRFDLIIISLDYWEKSNEVSSPAIKPDIPLLVVRTAEEITEPGIMNVKNIV